MIDSTLYTPNKTMHESLSPTTTLIQPSPSSSSGPPQALIMSIYRTQITNQPWLVAITWCKNLLQHGLSVSMDNPNGHGHYHCKLEVKPWHFWKKLGSKSFELNGNTIGVYWDLRAVKFNGEVEPRSDFYVAIVSEGEVVLVMGDMKKDAFRRTGCRPSLADPVLVSRKEHAFGKKRFATKGKFHEDGKFHEVLVECNGSKKKQNMEIRIDGKLVTEVKQLQWKFRGNNSIDVKEGKIDVYWDVHDWVFGSGTRHAMFLFKPSSSSSRQKDDDLCGEEEEDNINGSISEFCLFLYAWKLESRMN